MAAYAIVNWKPRNIFNSTKFMSTQAILQVKTQVCNKYSVNCQVGGHHTSDMQSNHRQLIHQV